MIFKEPTTAKVVGFLFSCLVFKCKDLMRPCADGSFVFS